jgi:hypothetical protein
VNGAERHWPAGDGERDEGGGQRDRPVSKDPDSSRGHGVLVML